MSRTGPLCRLRALGLSARPNRPELRSLLSVISGELLRTVRDWKPASATSGPPKLRIIEGGKRRAGKAAPTGIVQPAEAS